MAGLDPAIHPLRKNFSGKSMDPRVKPGGTVSDDPKKEKVPPCGGAFLLSLGASIRISGRPCPHGQVSGPDDWDLAVAVRASDRRPVADRASDWGSGSAGPASLWGWTSGSPWLNLVGHNPKPVELVSREPRFLRDYSAAAACPDFGGGNRGAKIYLYKSLRRSRRCCRTGFPLLQKPKLEKPQDATFRLPGPSPRLSFSLARQRMDYFAQQLINGIVLGSIYC